MSDKGNEASYMLGNMAMGKRRVDGEGMMM
jgi:hypothetical protein